MMALGMNQAYMLLKLHNKYYIVLIWSFGSIKGNILQIETKVNTFFLYWDNMDDF